MQNGGPPNGGPSGSSTLLSLGGNKNEMINGGGDEGMYRAGNGGSRYLSHLTNLIPPNFPLTFLFTKFPDTETAAPST